MILVKRIEIFEFRGVRHLEINLKGKNFAICGKNGTGKSGIVDALEFGLTGNISRLSGSGTGTISLKEHAPHVDSRSNPSKSKVIITLSLITLNKEVTIERSVDEIQNPIIKPVSQDILEVLNEVEIHPEFTLSRRELIKYVISTPGDRAKEVQTLLRLEKVENLRAILQKIANADKREVPPLKKQKEEAAEQLKGSLDVISLTEDKILSAVNSHRAKLNLSDIGKLSSTTSFRDGLTINSNNLVTLSKHHALNVISNLKIKLKDYKDISASEQLKKLTAKVNLISTNPLLITSLTKESFLRTALQLVEDEFCPVCDSELGMNEIKAIVLKKLEQYETVSKERKEIEEELEPYYDSLSIILNEISLVKEFGHLLKPIIDTTELDAFITKKQLSLSKLKSFLPVNDLMKTLNTYGEVPEEVDKTIDSIESAIYAIPEPSEQDSAREYLIIAQEKLENYRSISIKHKEAENKARISSNVSDIYGKVVTSTLEGLYKEVEANFIELYRFINNDDEADFTAQLTPSIGKLGFNVDFYGRGYFPPGAYHSEGHQDGMGLCLYLALMNHILGDDFTFAVLDDVLMSVDTGHRREVCKLLKEKFPKTQFIITTHDEVWLKHMKTAGLIQSGSSIQFRKWDVDNGPNEWNDKDVWEEISSNMKVNDVRSAASLLRHYLEYISADISHKLRAKVEFRGDANFMLGDLLPSATHQYTKLLEDAEKAAISWGKNELATELKTKKVLFKELITKSQLEQWQTNAAIHYNEWANLEATDFLPVAASFKNLIEALCCPNENCKSVLYVIPERGERDTLRCACGTN